MFVGIDLAKATFTVTLLATPQQLKLFGAQFENAEPGFRKLITRIEAVSPPQDCLFIMENTGVYGEKLCHFLTRRGLRCYVEPAHYIRRAFRLKRKTDPLDSRMIAEYGFRYQDQLHGWTPPDELVERVKLLMVNRELLQRQKTAHHNILKAVTQKEHADLPQMHQETLTFLETQVKAIDASLKALIQQNSRIRQHVSNLDSIPGVGLICCLNFLVLTNGFVNVDYKSLASYIGICPHDFESGSSVYRRPRADRKGSAQMRKQLYLSAMAAIKSDNPFRSYYLRKQAEGKDGKLILNNLRNKLLRIACAVILSNLPYDSAYTSVRIIK